MSGKTQNAPHPCNVVRVEGLAEIAVNQLHLGRKPGFFTILMQNGMNLAQIRCYRQMVLPGALLIRAVVVDQLRIPHDHERALTARDPPDRLSPPAPRMEPHRAVARSSRISRPRAGRLRHDGKRKDTT